MAINNGACGFVLKPILARELEAVVKRIVAELDVQKKSELLTRRFGFLHEDDKSARLFAASALRAGQPAESPVFAAAHWPQEYKVGYTEHPELAERLSPDCLLHDGDGDILFFFGDCDIAAGEPVGL